MIFNPVITNDKKVLIDAETDLLQPVHKATDLSSLMYLRFAHLFIMKRHTSQTKQS